MTLQNLSKILDKYEEQLGNTNAQRFELLKGLSFYDFDTISKSTFNHAIGLPKKNDKSYPLFDYEQMLFDTLQSNKHVWIKKATGLGVTASVPTGALVPVPCKTVEVVGPFDPSCVTSSEAVTGPTMVAV